MAQGDKVNMVEVEDILDARAEAAEKTQAAAKPDEKPRPNPLKPEMHPCGLPVLLLDKKQLTGYLKTHGIEHKDRVELDIQNAEREAYDIYTDALQAKRLPKEFFVAALRLWKHGYPINPSNVIRLNDMKITTLE